MNRTRLRINIFDLILSLSRVIDLMSPAIGKHHMQVGYLAYRIGEQMGLAEDQLRELMIAGILHDIGAFSLDDRLDLLEFEDTHPGVHAEAGYLILKEVDLFSSVANLVRFHHTPWRNGKGQYQQDLAVPFQSHILHLADRIAVLIQPDQPVLGQMDEICKTIRSRKGSFFHPEQVDAMEKLVEKDYIWLEVTSEFLEAILQRNFLHHDLELSSRQMLEFSGLICHLIDFKSAFTATHSSGVAASALCLSGLAGFSVRERRLMEIAAYLHDLGKLAIPSEILEKKSRLSAEEWFVMRSHVYYTYETLIPFDILRDVGAWGGMHQERLDGSGYPFGYCEDDIPYGARILAVADVFTALTEDRPYRKRMKKQDALDTMETMATKGELDARLVRMVKDHYSEMSRSREVAQSQAYAVYKTFTDSIRQRPTAN